MKKLIGLLVAIVLLAGCASKLTEKERDRREYVRVERHNATEKAMRVCEENGGRVRVERGMSTIGRHTRELGRGDSWVCQY